MAEIRDYSVTADDNNAASPNGMANGCAPSTVNDTWREGIARMKRWYEDCQGAKTTTGSSNAYLLAASRVVASYAAGDAYMFKANHTNTSAGSTLNVDSVGAKAIVTPTGAAIAAGSITSGGVYLVAYEASVDKFMLIGGSHSGGDNPFIYNSSPTLTLENSTSEDTSGGRESQVVFKGLQSGSEESTLVKITASHEGTSDDQKGQLVIGVNDGDDNDAPTTAVTVASTKNVTFAGNVESPELNLKNPTSEDTSGGRESQVVFKGLQSGGEESTLVKIQASHEGTDDDEKGQLIVGVNDGDDGSSPTTAVTIHSTGNTTLAKNLTLASDAAVLGFGVDSDVTLSHTADSGLTLSAGNNDTILQLDSNNDDAGAAPRLILNRTTDSPANNDDGGELEFHMENNNNQQVKVGSVRAEITNITDGSEQGMLTVKHCEAGVEGTTAMYVGHANGKVYIYNNTADLETLRLRQDNASCTNYGLVMVHDGAGVAIYGSTAGANTGVYGYCGAAHYGVRGYSVGSYAIYGSAGYSRAGYFAGSGSKYFIASYSSTYGGYSNGGFYSSTNNYAGSDSRLKDVTSQITTSDGMLAKVNSLKPIMFTWKENTDGYDKDADPECGFLAQEVKEVFPDLIHEAEVPDMTDDLHDNGRDTKTLNEELGKTLGMNYEKLSVYLAAALQEASKKIDALEARIAALES